jgi:hypothetical protein
MLTSSNLLVLLSLLWGIATLALAALAMYRAAISRREDDSLFLDDDARALMAGEQDVIVAKMDRLITPIKALAVVWGALLAATAGLWLWVGYSSF